MNYAQFHKYMAEMAQELHSLKNATVGLPKISAQIKVLHDKTYDIFADMPPPDEHGDKPFLVVPPVSLEAPEQKCWPILKPE